MDITLDNGYKLVSTFWMDFSIADSFDKKNDAVNDTFRRAFIEWKDDETYGPELAIVMSLKSCYWYGKDDELSKKYAELYSKIDGYIMDNYSPDAIQHYLDISD